MINIKDIVKPKLGELWKKHQDQPFCALPPFYPKEIKEDGIIFLGINPSISESDREQVLSDGENAKQSYDLHGANKYHSYFNKFIEISEKTGLDWTHFDVLYIRETKQSKVGDILKSKEGLNFIYRQCMITKNIIDGLIEKEPKKIFVVNNTLARRLLGKDKSVDGKRNIWMDYDFEWNDTIGTYLLNGHPFFFTSMLTGQRALDLGSFERLIWHINFVANKINR
jgi:hypothetical protein